ncbi:protease inhibitor I42 family protein [Chloroflexota bacterium]
MKRSLIMVTAVVVATCLVAGCVSGGGIYIDPEKTINSSVGSEFAIALDSNPTTGYDWEVSYDDNMLTLGDKEYTMEKCPGLVGAGGTQYFTFKALKKGETKITLDYQRSWEGESINQKVFTVNIK